MKQFNFRMFFDQHGDAIKSNNHVGSVHDVDGKLTSFARPFGYITSCVPAPHDKTWLEEQKKPKDMSKTTDLYLQAMDDYNNGRYRGRYPLWSKYWDMVKEINGVGRAVYPGMA